MKIKIYTLPNCSFSDKAKKFLKKKRLEFEEISLFKNEEARLEVINLSGQMATPIIIINEEMIIGFNESSLKTIIKKKKAEERQKK